MEFTCLEMQIWNINKDFARSNHSVPYATVSRYCSLTIEH